MPAIIVDKRAFMEAFVKLPMANTVYRVEINFKILIFN